MLMIAPRLKRFLPWQSSEGFDTSMRWTFERHLCAANVSQSNFDIFLKRRLVMDYTILLNPLAPTNAISENADTTGVSEKRTGW